MDGDERKVSVTLRLVGPITMEVFDPREPLTDEVIVSETLSWLWACRLQLDRLAKSFEEAFKHFRGPLPPGDDVILARPTAEVHFLLVAAGNLLRGLRLARRLESSLGLGEEFEEPLRHLRNVREHWEETRAAFARNPSERELSAAAFSARWPDARPWAITLDPAEGTLRLADVVDLNAFAEALDRLEPELRSLQAHVRAADELDG